MAEPSKTIKRPAKMGETIADAIADEILARNLPPGTRLSNEAEMVEQYGAGRGTVREAMRLLEADGLIEVRPGLNGGPVVREPNVERVARRLSILLRLSGSTFGSVIDARAGIEPSLALHAAEAATEEQLTELRASVERLAAAVPTGEGFVDENAHFHNLIAQASCNPILHTFWLAIRSIIDGQEVGMRYDEPARVAVVKAHRKILDRLEARDGPGAAAAMDRHVTALTRHVARQKPSPIDDQVRGLIGSSAR